MQLKVTDPKHFEQSQEINSRYNDTQKARIAKASKEFEGMLTSMMLKSMDKTTSGMFGSDSFGGDYFGTIFENQMASMISKKKDLGIADILYKKITGEALDPASSAKDLLKLINDSKIEIKKSTSDNNSITPSSKATDRLGKYESFINEASNSYGVDKNLIKSVILTESAANEKAVSSAKAKGLMQLIDSTASQMGVNNVFDPKENILGGTKYLSEMLRKYNGNLNLALASYNAGPENVQKYGGVPPFEETQNYIKRVIGYFNHLNGEDYGNERSL
jgi:soluble lytic murein transglycosylase-like protein